MPNYQNGKIYTIRCRTDNTLIYVGSTTLTLSRRMAEHRWASVSNNNKKLYNLVNGEWDNWYIELYEECPCENKQQLCKREGEIIREIATLNYEIAGRTTKEWRRENPDKARAASRRHYHNHRDEMLEIGKQYRKEHREEILEKRKQFREEHKAELLDKRMQYYYEVQCKDREELNRRQRENYAKRKAKLIE
jgi:hypothetical protein